MCRTLLFTAVAVLALVNPVSAQTGRAAKSNHKQPELFATIEHGIGWGGLFSRGPRVAVYRDGSVIFAKRPAGAREATYYQATLTADEFQQVDRALRMAFDVMTKDIHLAPGWQDLPEITLAARFGNQNRVVRVTGFDLAGHFSPPKTDKKKRPDLLPIAIDRGAKILLYLDPSNAQLWQPELFEVKLTSSLHEVPPVIHDWPKEWPDLKAKTTAETRYGRRGEPEYSVLLTAEEHQQFLQLTKQDANSYFSINGKTLSAYHWLPVLPDSFRWRQYRAVKK